MSVYKDSKSGKWTVYVRYTDWQGVRRPKKKEGFKTRREAIEFERNFLAKKSKDINMTFQAFVDIYLNDVKPRLKHSTFLSKKYVIELHVLPYFEKKSLCDIDATDILQWQNELLSKRDIDGKAYSDTYLRTIQNQLNAIFNHAYRYYGLEENPCFKVKKMGKSKAKEMLFWTKDEYDKFSEIMKSKPISYYAFEILYWTGIRLGELLALERGDINLEKKTLRINKSYQNLKGEEFITSPKTEKSNRVIDLPDFLCEELEDYFCMIYGIDEKTRLFCISKSYLHHEMDRGYKEAGIKRIRVHDLRHSHVAHLIELGFSPVAIAERLGHESAAVTYTYAHLYPSKQKSMANKLNEERKEEGGN